MDAKKMIGNVNVLDIRKSSEAAVNQIGKIGNANVVLYSPETAGLLSHLNFGNLNISVEIPSGDNVQVLMSKSTLNHAYFANKTVPEFLAIIGKMVVEGDVSVEDIQAKISGLVLMGKVICPESLSGILQSKCKLSAGKFDTYPLMSKVVINDLVLDEKGLNALDEHSELAVVGDVTFPVAVANNLIERKIARLYAAGGVKCHEENAATIQKRLHERTHDVSVIPAGYEWIEERILLDNFVLAQKKARKLYCSAEVQIDGEVSAEALDAGIDALVCGEKVYCPAALKDTLAKKCDLLKTRAVFYEGKLWMIEDEETLPASFLDALDSKLTLVVTGVLKIDPAIEPKALAERLAKVHNLGVIQCTPAQMGVVQLRLGLKEGVISDINAREEPAQEEDLGIGNANYLVL